MYYQLRKDCYIRSIGDYGYIKSSGLFNDLVFDQSGKAFLLAITRQPQLLDELTDKIVKNFNNVSSEDIKEDVKEFFDMLVDDGYVVKGDTIDECNNNNIGFNYNEIKLINFEENYTPKNIRSDVNTQIVLDEYFLKHPYLSNFQIELTSKCNERCVHCYIPHEYKIDDIEEDLYYKVLDQLEEMGTLGVTLSGGEPMVHPKFKEFLKAAKDRDFYVHVLSNLVLLDDEIVEIMRDGNTCGVQVSLYSMNPEHHDAITTVKGSFEKTKAAILKLIDNNIPVQISCPTMKGNKDDFIDVCKWAHEHKIRAITDYAIMAEYDHQTSNLANRLSPKEAGEVIKQVLEADEDYQRNIIDEKFVENIKNINIDPNEPFCGVGINTACMVANGNVYPCPGWQGYVCGNLYKDTLKNIWFLSKEMNKLRAFRKGDIPECMVCDDRAFCSPCLGRFANESSTGNPLEVAHHFCEVAKVNKKIVMEWREKND